VASRPRVPDLSPAEESASSRGPWGPGPGLTGEPRPVGQWAFAGVAVTSLGGPLALAALYAPTIVPAASQSAGLAMVASAAVFMAPLWIWLSYAREIQSAGGLYAFTEAAAGRRVALLQAGLWALSYMLYLTYTTAQIVYDTLPWVFSTSETTVTPSWETRHQALLELLIPVAMTGVMIAGRRAALVAIGLVAAGQLALAAVLGGVTLTNITTPVSSFGTSAPARSIASAAGLTSLLYICASLPFFLGGEVGRAAGPPRRRAFPVMRRGVVWAYAATVAVIIAAVAPLAAQPGFTYRQIPGMSVAWHFAGHGLALTIGIGVAASIGGVMLVEYLALSRLVTAVTSWPMRRVLGGIGLAMVAASAVVLINPDKIYDDLITPSLAALWLSQLMVFAVYPQFAARRGRRLAPALILAVAGVAFTVYGFVSIIQHSPIS
jgi:hypothetical protein